MAFGPHQADFLRLSVTQVINFSQNTGLIQGLALVTRVLVDDTHLSCYICMVLRVSLVCVVAAERFLEA